ncbi:MAG: formylglycine-generating enzyme family protein [Myxococcota bacterium]
MIAALLCLLMTPVKPDSGGYVRVPGGAFTSALESEGEQGPVRVGAFLLMRRPVTNGEFLAFVRSHPGWQRGKQPSIYADAQYLARWAGPRELGPGVEAEQPVVEVSWFAATAYCEAQGARLPQFREWEYASAADAHQADARKDPSWRQAILDWYAKPSRAALAKVGSAAPNVYGIQDLHGLVWEWVEDYSALGLASDNRAAGGADKLALCGGSALTMKDRENYPIAMRVAMLSALGAKDTTMNLGFRCAKSLPEAKP